MNADTAILQKNGHEVVPHAVAGASINYNNVERALQREREADEIHRGIRRGSESSVNGLQGLRRGRRGSDTLGKISHENKAVINEKLSHRYYSTGAGTAGGNSVVTDSKTLVGDGSVQKPVHSGENENAQGRSAPTPESLIEVLREQIEDTRLDDSAWPWEEDKEAFLNKETFLHTQMEQINECLSTGKYNRVNAIYQSLKRNDVVPPLPVFEQVLESICKRDMDEDNIDAKMFELLNCYQNVIQNKLKPTKKMYCLVVGSLISGSIKAFDLHNANGLDFFKIAVDLFFASNLNHSHDFDQTFLDNMLLAINLYPGHVKFGYMKSFIDSSVNYDKTEVYYITLLSYAKMLNRSDSIKDLYQEFRSQLLTNQRLVDYQYEVYSVLLSAFVETGSLNVATKLLDKLLINLQHKVGHNESAGLVLSNFLISVGKLAPEKAYALLTEFSKLKFVPEFSYEFYMVMIANCLNSNWELVKTIYDYIFPMKISFRNRGKKLGAKDYLLYPSGLESMPSTILTYALRQKDNDLIMKLLEESIVKKFSFQSSLYPYIFRYFRSVRCPDAYLLRFIDAHGSLVPADKLRFEFLNALVDNYQSQVLLKKTTEMPFFIEACKNFSLEHSSTINYAGFIACFQANWKSPQMLDQYSYNLELHGTVISKIYDLDEYYAGTTNDTISEFKEKVADRFRKLLANYRRIHLDANKVSPVVVQAMKMIDVPEDTLSYFQHPGDWDKSYPLSLGSTIRNSKSTGIKQYLRLKEDGYCFDYDTYAELVHQKFIDAEIISQIISNCPDTQTMKYISNTIVIKCLKFLLEKDVLNHPLFLSTLLPNLSDKSLLRIASNCSNITHFIEKVEFPERFKSIAVQAEFKQTIAFIYDSLMKAKAYGSIIGFNETVPCLNLQSVLKSCIRGGDYEKYSVLMKKFKSELTIPEYTVLKAEYLINNQRIEEAMSLLEDETKSIPHRTADLYTFALFLMSFKGHSISFEKSIENTLQLANVISSQVYFNEMIHVYEEAVRGESFTESQRLDGCVKLELCQQILNNFEDSLQFIDLKNKDINKVFNEKMKNYLRFRSYLKINTLSETEMTQLIKIWYASSPAKVDSLFNNIVETLCLNNDATTININDLISFDAQKSSILKYVNLIKQFYLSDSLADEATKAKKFADVLVNSLT